MDIAVGEATCNYAGVKVADRPLLDGRDWQLFSIEFAGCYNFLGKSGYPESPVYAMLFVPYK